MMSASACAKLILCGEHAVVYGCPAIALPISDLRAVCHAHAAEPGSGLYITAPDLHEQWYVTSQPEHPLSELALQVVAQLYGAVPDLILELRSAIPTASGMGSGAAVATALVRVLAEHIGQPLPPAQISELVYQSERRFHGTPSGIDNTVIAYEQPMWFVRSESGPQIMPLAMSQPLQLLIGDTGVRSSTKLPVGAVRERRQQQPERYQLLFQSVTTVVEAARDALAVGDLPQLGQLLSQNHQLLQEIGVSSPELDRLVEAAQQAGALGAKLSGAGWGGVMLALVTDKQRASVEQALHQAGAARVLHSWVVAMP